MLPGVAVAWIFSGEVPDPRNWLGVGIILAGALVITIAGTRRKK